MMQLVGHGFFTVPSWPVLANFVRVQLVRPFSTELLRSEWISLFLSLLLCMNPWIVPARWLTSLRLSFHKYAQNRARAVLTCFLFPIVVRVALLPVAPLKPPSVHDEFSWLLMADTFRSGRLTNPTHPYWPHFETIHEIQRPTYASMYPPAYSAILAFGQLLGNPWIGVVLSVGLLCGAICWMLQAWLPPAWALRGGLLAALQIGIGSYWMNSYVGGATVPAMAGALLTGAMPRLVRRPTPTLAAIFALAVVLLMNSRPFEGAVLSVLCFTAAIVLHREGKGPGSRNPVIRWPILAPAVVILIFGAIFTAYYSWRVTGSPLKMPYVVNRDTYGWPENLAILPPKEVSHRLAIIENAHRAERGNRNHYATLGRMLDDWCGRFIILWEFFVGPGLTLPMLMLPWTIRSPKLRAISYIGLCMLALNTLQLVGFPQYLSPTTAIIVLFLLQGLRQVHVCAKRKGLSPERVMAGLVLCVACSAAFNLWQEPLHIRPGTFWERPAWPYRDAHAAILSKLEYLPGRQLVFVIYGKNHSSHEEWVYNAADIDKSKVVWLTH